MWLINISIYLKSMQFLSLCKNPHYVIHILAYDILKAWTPSQAGENFTYLETMLIHRSSPHYCLQDCFCSAKPPILENRGGDCYWSHSGARMSGPQGYPGTTQQHPSALGLHRGSCRTTCTLLPHDAHLNLFLTPCLCYEHEKRKTETS